MAQVLNFKSHKNELLVLNINEKQYTINNSVCNVMDAIEASQEDGIGGTRKVLEILLGKKETTEIMKSDMSMDDFITLASQVLILATTGNVEQAENSFRNEADE